MITPIRGRKAIHSCTALAFANMIRNDNPDKGTEGGLPKRMLQPLEQRLEMITPIRGRKLLSSPSPSSPGFPIRNDNPDKGTEAVLKTYYLQALLQVIRNDNPDKGTEALAALDTT